MTQTYTATYTKVAIPTKSSESVGPTIVNPTSKANLVYDGTEQELITAGSGATFKYSVEHESVVSETGTIVPLAVDAGDYIVRYSIDNGTTWSKGINVSIAKRDVTIASTTDSKTYDGTPLVCAEAADAWIEEGSLGAGDTFSVTMNTSITNAGSVTNKIDDAVIFDIDSNDISYNYNITKQEGTLTVIKRNVILTSASATKAYDGTKLIAEEVTVSGDGFADGEGVTKYTFVNNSADAAAVGVKSNKFKVLKGDINCDVNNYNWTLNYGTLTITPALVDLPTIADITYDGAMHDIEADYADSRYDFNCGDTSATDAGTYNVGITLKDPNNYAWNLDTPVSNDQTITWKITKRNVTLTSGNASKTYDGNPLTTAYPTVGGDGFVSGQDLDWASTASITEVGSTQATFTVKKVIDNYNDGADVTNNYNITCNYGTLTVTEAPALCSKYENHYKVTKVGALVSVDVYYWNGTSFTDISQDGPIPKNNFEGNSADLGSYYVYNGNKYVKCTNNH